MLGHKQAGTTWLVLAFLLKRQKARIVKLFGGVLANAAVALFFRRVVKKAEIVNGQSRLGIGHRRPKRKHGPARIRATLAVEPSLPESIYFGWRAGVKLFGGQP